MGAKLKFRRIAGSSQAVIENSADLALAAELDPAQWAVIGMPLDSIVFDPDFLAMIDTDRNGRIRPDELRNAIRHLLEQLEDHSGIDEGSDTLKLSAIRTSVPGSDRMLASAKLILANLGTPDAKEITLEQVLDRKNLVLNSCGNGDGIITVENNPDPLLVRYIEKAIAACGSVPDITGLPGINEEISEKFSDGVDACRIWLDRENEPVLSPFGPESGAFYDRFSVVREKLDRYFELCGTVSGGDPERFACVSKLDPLDAKAVAEFLENAPCAAPGNGRVLRLSGWVNPLWRKPLEEFLARAETLGISREGNGITEEEWSLLKAKFAPRTEWLASKPPEPFASIPKEDIRDFTDGNARKRAAELIGKDASVKTEIEAYEDLRKLIVYQHRMIEFVNNFITLSRLFDPSTPSLIQSGHLIMDGRHFTLAVKVTDIGAHKKIIERSNICVMYVELSTGQPEALRKMTLAVAVTSGSMRDLFVGRTGVFIGADGTEWDAKVTDFVQQPVSVSEALQTPFYRFGGFLGKQADKFFTSKSKDMETSVGGDLAGGRIPGRIADAGAGKQTPAISGSMMLMGGGVGLAALGSAFAFLVNSLKTIPVWNVLVVLIGIIFIISGPMMLVSFLKLCSRHVSDFLAAGGWAVNPKMRLSRRMGLIFTHEPKLPLDAMMIGGDAVKIFSKDFETAGPKRLIWLLAILGLLLAVCAGLWIYLDFDFSTIGIFR